MPPKPFCWRRASVCCGVALEPEVVHPFHRGVRFQPPRHRQRVGAVGLHAQAQRLETLEEDPGIEWTHARTRGAHDLVGLVADRVVVGDDGAADAATLPVQVLGGGMDHHVGPEGERALQGRGAHDVVDRELRAALVRQRGDLLDVHRPAEWIRRTLEDQKAGFGANGIVPLIEVDEIHVGRVHPEAREDVVEERDGGSEHVARDHHMVARLQDGEPQSQDCPHARCRRHATGAAFQRSEALLESSHAGIGESRVDIAGLGLGEARRRFFGAPEREARRQEDRIVVLAFGAATLAFPHRKGVETGVAAALVVPLHSASTGKSSRLPHSAQEPG